ncbi:MAG: acetate kinase [Oscillospiraceae bacterium]|nr:acetate kinase [Oscillospiraceae bacterium]
MKVLVINAGSSSMKYQLIDMDNEAVIAKGNCERIGNGGMIGHKLADGTKIEYDVPFPTHAEAFAEVLKLLTTGEHKVVNDMSEIAAVGHRTVHGGEKFASSVLITEDVLKAIDELSTLAPLHNPPGLAAIRASKEVFGEDTPMVAVFDTAFHQTMPAKAYMYGIPYEYYEKYGVRRYGFHGTSHRFVAGRCAELMGKEDIKIVTCHLGNGSSISAVVNGKVIDTTLGMTTNAGIIMGTRSGDVDPGLPAFIAEKAGTDFAGATNILQKKSGLEGVSGVSSDMRDIESAIENGNERAKLAWEMLAYQIKKYVGAYAAAMGGCDAVVFTGGIGENDDSIRAAVCADMEFMGIEFDAAKNKGCREEACVSAEGSKVKVWVIPTNEELLIARDTKEIVSK